MDTETTQASSARKKSQPWWFQLWFQVLVAMVLGILLGHFFPAFGAKMQPLGDAFIKAIRVLIAPIIFCTVVHGMILRGADHHCSDHWTRCGQSVQAWGRNECRLVARRHIERGDLYRANS